MIYTKFHYLNFDLYDTCDSFEFYTFIIQNFTELLNIREIFVKNAILASMGLSKNSMVNVRGEAEIFV